MPTFVGEARTQLHTVRWAIRLGKPPPLALPLGRITTPSLSRSQCGIGPCLQPPPRVTQPHSRSPCSRPAAYQSKGRFDTALFGACALHVPGHSPPFHQSAWGGSVHRRGMPHRSFFSMGSPCAWETSRGSSLSCSSTARCVQADGFFVPIISIPLCAQHHSYHPQPQQSRLTSALPPRREALCACT
jgi:hypothetical protein